MARQVAQIERNSLLLLAPEIDDGTLQRATPPSFVTTGAGAADGSTLVSTALIGAANTDYLGCWLRCENGANARLLTQIIQFVAGTDTATIDPPLPSQVLADVTFSLRRPSHPVFKTTGAGAANELRASQAVDAAGVPVRDEAAESWSATTGAALRADRYFAICRGGTADDRAALIVDDGAVGGGPPTFKVFTLAAGSGIVGATSANDLFEIYSVAHPAESGWVTQALATQVFEVQALQGAAGVSEQQPHVLGPRLGADRMAIPFHLREMAAAANGAALAQGPNEIGDILRGIFALNSDGSSAAAGVPTTTSVPVTAATGTRFGNGAGAWLPGMVWINGEAALITDLNGDTLTLRAGHLTAAPVAGAVVSGGWTLYPLGDPDSFRSMFVSAFPGGRRVSRVGWLANLKIEAIAAGGGIVRMAFEGPFDGTIDDGLVLPTLVASSSGTRFPEAAPAQSLPVRSLRVVLGALPVDCKEFTLDTGYDFQRRESVHGYALGDGCQYVGRKTMGTLKYYVEDQTRLTRLDAFHLGTEMDLLVQIGTRRGGTFAIAAPAIQFSEIPAPAVENGKLVQTVPFRVLRSGLVTATGGINIPDLMLSYL